MNKTTDSKTSQALMAIPAAVVLVFILGLLQAYVISQIWGWFAVKHFGLPHLPVLVAYGLLIGANVAGITREAKEHDGLTEIVASALFRILFGWLAAYIIYCLV